MNQKNSAIIIILLIPLIFSITYICIANIYNKSYIGELTRAEVFADLSCTRNCDSNGRNCHTRCNNAYYVDEIFKKNKNSMSTCTVRRMTRYSFRGDADNFVSKVKLNTQRKLYETTYSSGTCIDNKIKNYCNTVGIVCMSIFVLFIIIIFIIERTTFCEIFNVPVPEWCYIPVPKWCTDLWHCLTYCCYAVVAVGAAVSNSLNL